MNRRQLLGAGIAATVSSWLPWRSVPKRPLPPVLNPLESNESYAPEEWARQLNIVLAAAMHEGNGQ